MTLEALLNCSADELEKLSDAELTNILAPKFTVTRPDVAAPKNERPRNVSAKSKEDLEKEAKKKRAIELAAKFGMKLNL